MENGILPVDIRKRNPFIEGILKNVGREIEIDIFFPDGKKKIIKGICEGVDLVRHSILIKDEKCTHWIRNFFDCRRPRAHPPEKRVEVVNDGRKA
jgi:hypothetical protein